ncbi:mdm2-binding protein isoform X1 [Ictalurus punctatus]|uniref:Mdm2-binding protein n=1 Tax=Ictalurus punctatus TaxID=7998 RepID=W5UEX4_ICTPU|nr:mdm2-binding protein isoform X1 [Ictalurus punctatus]XP_017326563.1 mdm2-binding protein isoform X1 [Ictalurus punctatus]
MDRYVLIVVINQEAKKESSFSGIEAARKVYNKLKDICRTNSTSRLSPFPACSLSGTPAFPKWFFAIQATCGSTQFCSSEWDELCVQHSDDDESVLSPVDSCASALQEQEELRQLCEITSHLELFEDAAECLHQLADKLPPPGRFLLDVILLCEGEVGTKDLLPVIGSLKHMQAWQSAQMTIITEHSAGWRTAASYLSGRVCSPSDVETCIDAYELWRGGLLIREKKFVSELLFEGFSLKWQIRGGWSHTFFPHSDPCCFTDHMIQPEVFHYYQPVLELIQLVRIADLPVILLSSTEFELALSSKSAKAKLLLEQLRALRGQVGALFSLSCVVSVEAFPPASQLSASKWRDFVAKCPKVFSAPDVKVKGEKGHYLLLVQGAETGSCRARLIHSANQINGAVALATISSLVQENVSLSSGTKVADWLHSLPPLCGDDLLRRERRLARVQHQVVQECARRREEAQKPAAVPLNDLRVLLRLAREQYLKMQNATQPRVSCVPVEEENHTSVTGADVKHTPHSEWPERSVLRNYENTQKILHKNRSSLFSSGSSDCLMGPKDGQKSVCAPLDARELLKHFTADGLPSGELQPLPVLRGDNAFQLSPDLTPRKVTRLQFRQAASAHYHGIEFCLDERKALERDCGFARLQSRLIRFETQTTCCKEPCPVPLALSPMPAPTPSPSEPGSVPDGEAAQNEPPRLKRHAHEPDPRAHQQKRLAKSESSESLGSQCSGGSGTHPAVRALQQRSGRSLSCSSSTRRSTAGAESSNEPPASQKCSQGQTESRSQKHNRMLKEVVAKTLKHCGITSEHKHFKACSQRLFDVSKLYLKDLKTSRGLHEEMRKAAGQNAKQVIDWVVEKAKK